MIAGELKDPRIGFVTVTRVSLAPDLRSARVFVGVLGSELDRQKSLAGLSQAAGYLRRLLGQRLRLRHTPQIVFEYDTGLDAADRVAKLLESTRVDTAPSDEPDLRDAPAPDAHEDRDEDDDEYDGGDEDEDDPDDESEDDPDDVKKRG